MIMKLNQVLMMAGVAFALSLGVGPLAAQDQPPQRPGRGNFDPEQFRQRMMDRYREQLEVKSDDEWKVISERINKVLDARREMAFGGAFGRGFGRRGSDGNEPSGDDRRRRVMGGEPSPEAEALQKAIEAKAPADEIKAKLAKYRQAHKDKEAKLEKAQEDLRKVLSVRQEAAVVLAGLLQ
jgi:hypothetical protein